MTRVAAFAAALAALLAGAFAAGALLGDGEPASATGAAGLAVAEGGLRLVAETTLFTPGRATPFSFRILDERGEAVRAYDVTGERPMHLVVVRRDLAGFQHLHPAIGADGTWTTPLELPAGGAYRALADFSTGGVQRTLGIDLLAGGDTPPLELPRDPAQLASTVYEAGVPQTLRFDAGGPVGRYLGAAGSLVVLRQGDLGYVRTRADADALVFETTFPSPGGYRAFLEYLRGGRLHLAVFDLGAR